MLKEILKRLTSAVVAIAVTATVLPLSALANEIYESESESATISTNAEHDNAVCNSIFIPRG